MRIIKGDQVVVLSGNDKGKKGKVLKVFPHKGQVIISGINFIKRHTKPNQKQQQGGIVEKEAPVHISNVLVVCPKCGEPTRIAANFLEDGQKVRTCKVCNEVMV